MVTKPERPVVEQRVDDDGDQADAAGEQAAPCSWSSPRVGETTSPDAGSNVSGSAPNFRTLARSAASSA